MTRSTRSAVRDTPSKIRPKSRNFGSSDEEIQKTPRKNKNRAINYDLNQISPVTPPKQLKKTEECENIKTPSSLLKNLNLTSSPQKESKNKKELFKSDGDVYQTARKALHSTFVEDLPGREEELKKLKEFLNDCLNNEKSGSLYISGPPGTGKTASLNIIMQQNQFTSKFHQIYVNCTSIKSSGAIFSRISKELGLKIAGKSEKIHLSSIENYLNKKHKTILLILDEIDQLESKNQSVLYTIFEWPLRLPSQIILIGIANALDLTDRILPRLQAKCELKPILMHFAPYTKQQIINIFISRLKSENVLNVFSPVALQMLAAKVSAISGDVRRALDIGRRVIETMSRSNILKSMENVEKSVNIKQVSDVLNNVYGTSQNLNDDSNDNFPLQQKIVICSLLLMLKKGKNKDVTVGKLHNVYKKVCTSRNLTAVDQSEFVGICSLIETRGIIKIIKKKESRLSKIKLEWDEDEVGNVLKDKQLMASILDDDNCLK